jgi:short-subunit dehydrogenase
MKITDNAFNGKVIAITGASSGIGQALAVALAQKGASLALADLNENGLLKTSELVGNAPVHITTLNVSDRAAVQKWADDVAAHYGHINIIINNAGLTLKGYIEDTSYEEIDELLGVNLFGVIYGTKAFLPYLQASGDGHIVNVSSLFGLIAMPKSGIYATSKFAVRGFTECLRQELELTGSKVTATCVFPGGIKTNIVRNARIAKNSRFQDKEGVEKKFDKNAKITPEKAAEIIIDGILKKKHRVIIGKIAHLFDFIQRIFPAGYQKVTKKVIASEKY